MLLHGPWYFATHADYCSRLKQLREEPDPNPQRIPGGNAKSQLVDSSTDTQDGTSRDTEMAT